MTLMLIISLIEAIVILLICLAVLKSDTKKSINRIFFIFAIALASWSLFVNISANTPSLTLARLVDVLGLFAGLMLVVFAVFYPVNSHNLITKFLVWLFTSFVLVLAPLVMLTPLIVSDISIERGSTLPINGELSWLYFLIIFCEVLAGIAIIAYKYFWEYRRDVVNRKKISFVVIGVAVGALLILMSFIPFLIDGKQTFLIDNAVPFSVMIFIIFIAYGILKGGLFDVRMAIVRSVTYSMVIATLAGLYTVMTLVLSSLFRLGDSSPIELVSNVFISLVLVFLFQPLRRFFDRITNEIFYKDNYDTDDFFGRVNKILAITTDLKDLLRKTSLEISKTLKASQAFFYILTDNGKIVAAGTAESSTLAEADLLNIFSYASKKGQITVATLLEDNDPVKKLLSDNKIEIALPLMKGKKLVGLFLMGENMSSNYTGRDISVLETLSNGLVVAILNALAVQEIRDFNVTLRHKIDEATKELRVKNTMLKKLDKAKDEFVSMASHQLRTPLTSVKGYLSMVVDGDAGKVTKQQKELLDEAYISNEKMVNLVNDFLNVSRIQTGKFMLEKIPVDLAKLVDGEVKGLVQNAKKRGIKLAYRADKDIPNLTIDEGKIRQVVMNYIDNAIYYSHQDSTIKIDLVVDGKEVVFTVKDTGIGVPISEQAGLFTKFYRASNAKKQRPDGTGVGLYLAKRIITAHDGKIVFRTIEGQGSTFGFRLPID